MIGRPTTKQPLFPWFSDLCLRLCFEGMLGTTGKTYSSHIYYVTQQTLAIGQFVHPIKVEILLIWPRVRDFTYLTSYIGIWTNKHWTRRRWQCLRSTANMDRLPVDMMLQCSSIQQIWSLMAIDLDTPINDGQTSTLSIIVVVTQVSLNPFFQWQRLICSGYTSIGWWMNPETCISGW